MQLQYRREARYEATDLFAVHVSTDADRHALHQFPMQPPLPEGRPFVMPDRERDTADAHREEMLAQSALWVRDYQDALAQAGLARHADVPQLMQH